MIYVSVTLHDYDVQITKKSITKVNKCYKLREKPKKFYVSWGF